MALSRKRKKDLDQLRSAAAGLWEDQKSILENAGRVMREATQHAAEVNREEVAPRLRDVAESARDRVSNDVLPGVSSAVASALALVAATKDTRAAATPQKNAGPGRYILAVVGLVALAGVAYAAWQTLRADDELWVSDDPDDDGEERVVA